MRPCDAVTTVALWIYRIVWEPVAWTARLLAIAEKIAGGNLWPARWRLADRLGRTWPPPSPRGGGGRGEKTIWLHAASLGESKGVWAFAQTLRDLPVRFVLTANTTSGLGFLRERIAQEAEPDRWNARLAPLDHPRVIAKFLRAFDVRALVLFEVELWPHAVLKSRQAGLPVLWISARLTQRARRRYGIFPGALRRVLREIEWTQAQTGEEADALRALGCDPVETGGDLRGLHSLGETDGRHVESIPWYERRGAAFVSFHAEELPVLAPLLAEADEERPLIVFPRKMENLPKFRKELEPLGFALHSECPDADRVIVDSFGRVAEALARCRVAVVGGSFVPRGGHNLWEPLLAGTRLATGPHHENQAWLAERLRGAGLLRVVRDAAEWKAFLTEKRGDPADGNVAAVARSVLQRAARRARGRVAAALFPG